MSHKVLVALGSRVAQIALEHFHRDLDGRIVGLSSQHGALASKP
jgi:hypothetical protein